MKKGLIIIFLSILCFNCITLYSQEQCKVLKQEIAEKYVGKCKNGLAHGKGIAEGKDKYEGEFKNGLPQGLGKYTWSTGEVYEGRWKEGKREGEGKYYYKKNGIDSVKYGVWGKDIFIKKIVPSPYKVIRSTSVSRYTIRRIGEGERVLVAMMQMGNPNLTVTNLMFSPSSGNAFSLGSKQGYQNVTFPFSLKISYTTLNLLQTSSYPVEFEVEIKVAGDWEITLVNS